MKKNTKNLICFLTVFALLSCSKNKADDTSKFIDVYSDMLVISANRNLTDSLRRQQIDSLLMANQYTADKFKQITDKYAKDHGKWKDIYKEIVETIEIKKRNL
jgi:predicted N-formylglutamate amidohydrolase